MQANITLEQFTRLLSPSLQRIKTCLLQDKLYLKAESVIIFTCGRKPDLKNPTVRDKIMQYAKEHMNSFKFFMAEDFFRIFKKGSGEKLDLLTLEEKIGKYSDCIIIILESESAFAELGAFALKDDLAKILLAINELEYESDDSFISKGPIEKLQAKSKFKPIHVDFQTILTYIPEIREKLNNIEKKYGRKIRLTKFDHLRNCDPKVRILFLADLISFFSPVSKNEIKEIVSEILEDGKLKQDVKTLTESEFRLDNTLNANKEKGFGVLKGAKKKLFQEIDFELSLLEAIGLIEKIENQYISIPEECWLFFDYKSLNPALLRSEIIVKYNKRLRDKAELLGRRE